MTTIFQKKQQRILILIFILLIMIVGMIIWWKLEPPLLVEPLAYKKEIEEEEKIKINFEVLEFLILEEFKPFFEIKPFEQEIGRENPFIVPGNVILENQEIIPEDIILNL